MSDIYSIIDYSRKNPTRFTEEIYTNVGTSFTLGTVKRGFLGSTFELRSTPAGAKLTIDVDYELDEQDALYSGAAYEDEPVYTKINILNATYETGNLYVTYDAVFTYVSSASTVLQIKRYSGWGNIANVSATTYTVEDRDGIIELDDSSNAITVTLPDRAANVGRSFTIRVIDGTNGATINRAGTDTITRAGLTSVTLTSDGGCWTFLAGSTRWELVDGTDAGSNANGNYVKHADGTLMCTGLEESTTPWGTYGSGGLYISGDATWTFPVAFVAAPTVSAGEKFSTNIFTSVQGGSNTTAYAKCLFNSNLGTARTIMFTAIGRWYA